MKLIIDIDEELYENVIEHTKKGYVGSDVWIAVANGKPYEKPGPKADPKSGDLISRESLREQIDDCEYFNSSFQKMTVAEFLTIVHDIIGNAPSVEPKRPHIIDNCDMNVFEPEKMMEGE